MYQRRAVSASGKRMRHHPLPGPEYAFERFGHDVPGRVFAAEGENSETVWRTLGEKG